MKNIFKTLFCLAAVSTALISCNESYEPYEVGEDEVAGCYGVYFPAQEAAGSHTLDPTQDPSATFTVKRTNTDGAITVPIVATYSEDGIFTISPVQFENGQSETTFTVSFPNAVEGTTYEASFEIQDPQYASKYNNNPIAIDYSVMRVSWSTVEDPTATGSSSTVTFTEGWWGETHKVHIKYYEVNGVRHCQVDGTEACDLVYSDGSTCAGGMWGNGNNFEFTWDTATNKINVPKQVMFTHSSYGYVYVYGWYEFFISDGGYSAASLGDAANFYTNNGASYPQSYYDGNGGFYFNLRYYVPGVGGWTPDQFDVVGIAEGFTRVDYSIEISAGETAEGVMPIYFETLGADVAKVKYVAYEGTLSATQINNKVSGISAGTEENISEYVVEEGATGFGVTLDKSGVYTLVAVACDETGAAQNSASVEFCYVAKGDEEAHATVVNAGIELTSRYEASGYDKRNSAQFYVYGKDITDAKVGLYKTSTVESYGMEAVVAAVMESESLDAAAIEEVNNGGYADVMTGLAPLTSYTLVVWATNGYTSTAVTAEVTTEGLDRIKMTTGTYTYNYWWEGEDPGYEFYQDPNYENTYIITNWGGGVDFTFTYDPATKKVVVPSQAIGYTHSTYGAIYVGEAKNIYSPTKYEGYADLADSYYDEASSTFYFSVAYYCAYGVFGDAVETFKLDEAVKFGAEATTTALYKGVNVRSTDKQLSKGHISLEKDSPANISCPAGIKAEWEGVSVPVKTVSVDFSNVQKSDRNMEISKEHISLR